MVLRYTDRAGWDECGWSLQGLCDALILSQKSADRRGCKTADTSNAFSALTCQLKALN